MILHHSGLLWDVPSPSFWRLQLPNRTDSIDVSYLGTRNQWCLFLEREGNVSTRCFPSRDDAIGMVVQAFKNEGAL